MRSVLPERRHVNGHTLLEGAIAKPIAPCSANSGRRSASGSVLPPNELRIHVARRGEQVTVLCRHTRMTARW